MGAGSVSHINGQDLPSNCVAKLELVCVGGGPVFLFRGRRDLTAAYDATHGAQDPDFDLAAGPNNRAEMYVENYTGYLTLHADVDTIGFLRLTKETD